MFRLSAFIDFVDLLFPRNCVGCKKPLTRVENQLCLVCTQDLPHFKDQDELIDKFAGRLLVTHISSFLKFSPDGIVQQLLHAMKYQYNPGLAVYLGREMGKAFEPILKNAAIDVIIPVPLHRSKQRTRGYNQSEKLATGLAEIVPIPVVTSALVRTRRSETQTKKTRDARWKNVADIFMVSEPGIIKDMHILLIDDVITTGATAEACGRSIMAAGAGRLSLAFMASA